MLQLFHAHQHAKCAHDVPADAYHQVILLQTRSCCGLQTKALEVVA